MQFCTRQICNRWCIYKGNVIAAWVLQWSCTEVEDDGCTACTPPGCPGLSKKTVRGPFEGVTGSRSFWSFGRLGLWGMTSHTNARSDWDLSTLGYWSRSWNCCVGGGRGDCLCGCRRGFHMNARSQSFPADHWIQTKVIIIFHFILKVVFILWLSCVCVSESVSVCVSLFLQLNISSLCEVKT